MTGDLNLPSASAIARERLRRVIVESIGEPRYRALLATRRRARAVLRISRELVTDPELRDGLARLKRRVADDRPPRATPF